MHRIQLRVMFALQHLVLRVSYTAARLWRAPGRDWVVGPYETAGLVHDIARALPSASSVLLAPHPFYDRPYDWTPRPVRGRFATIFAAWFRGPALLGRLAASAQGFVYVSGAGYLDDRLDHRMSEFRFLARRGRAIVCFFTGNDIRSPQLMAEQEVATGEPNLATYLAETDPVFGTPAYEQAKRAIAASADAFASVIVNAEYNQRSHLTRPAEKFPYFYPDDDVVDTFDKFADTSRPVILHAPSSPLIKGTQLVRAAIAELRDEGYDFEYVELVRQPHAQVQEQLRRAHVVLNQFYSEVPGVFGVEALAAGCVVLQRADEHDEASLPPGSNDAWVLTRHHQVTRHLRAVLDAPNTWESQARAGVDWVREHAVFSVAGPRFAETLARALTSA